jgi:hypothetical protein
MKGLPRESPAVVSGAPLFETVRRAHGSYVASVLYSPSLKMRLNASMAVS